MPPDLIENSHWSEALLAAVQKSSSEAGFVAAGVADAESGAPDERFVEWVEAGRAGEMEWLKRRDHEGRLLRSAVQVAIPWARSVVVCAMNYNADAPGSLDPAAPGQGWIGRYAWSGREAGDTTVPVDYHDDLLSRLRRVEGEIRQRSACETRCYVDTGPIVERAAAAKAGIGWIGKNTCILRQGTGSWLLLGVIVTSLPFPEAAAALHTPAADRCGSCTRCLDACPTGALVAPREMDSSLCISYLTIEKKGAIPVELRGRMGRQVFGCDICQDVCPWNRRAPIATHSDLVTRQDLVNPSLAMLAELDGPGFRRLFKGSPLERTGRRRLHRNVAIAMGNSGDPGFIPQLETWCAADDPVLAESAAWALQTVQSARPDELATGVETPSATLNPVLRVHANDADSPL